MKILVADNDAADLLKCKKIISDEGHEVICVENTNEIITLAKKVLPNAVILSTALPSINLQAVVQQLKYLHEEYSSVIVIAGVLDDVDIENAINAGVDDIITRPINTLLLKSKLSIIQRMMGLCVRMEAQQSELIIHKDQLQRELRFAESIIESIRHNVADTIPGITTLYEPAGQFSGDIVLISHTPTGGVNILIGDVSGHSLASSIYAIPVSEIFNTMSSKGFQLQSIIAEINARLSDLLPTGIFLAANIIHIDKACKTLTVWCGGLPDIYIRDHDQGVKSIPSMHLPLGVMKENAFDASCELYDVSPGDYLTMVTRGFHKISCLDAGNENINLRELICNESDNDAMINQIQTCIDMAKDEQRLTDDITLLSIHCDPDSLRPPVEKAGELNVVHSKTWKAAFEFSVDILQQLDPLPHMIQCLTGLQGIEAHRVELFTILSELFTNALDHGLLGLDSTMKKSSDGFIAYYTEKKKRLSQLEEGYIKVFLETMPSSKGTLLTMTVEDSGSGFDQSQSIVKLENNQGNSGRGIPLITTLCEEINYNGKGNCVTARYAW